MKYSLFDRASQVEVEFASLTIYVSLCYANNQEKKPREIHFQFNSDCIRRRNTDVTVNEDAARSFGLIIPTVQK